MGIFLVTLGEGAKENLVLNFIARLEIHLRLGAPAPKCSFMVIFHKTSGAGRVKSQILVPDKHVDM